MTKKLHSVAVAFWAWAAASTAWSAESSGVVGDVGAGTSSSSAAVRRASDRVDALPYVNAEYGPVFGRIDTFGVKTLQLGAGHLELVAQFRGDGYAANALDKRQDSVPLGLSTLQITPYGGFGLAALRDVGRSRGGLLQLRYVAQWAIGPVTLYPDLGVEAQSRAYTRYYFGTTTAEAALFGRAYTPGAAVNVFAGLLVETRLAEHWYLNAYLRRMSLDRTVTKSPLVEHSHIDTGLVALAYRF